MIKSKKHKRQKSRFSIRKKVSGTLERPRLAVFRSNKEIYAQVIDDLAGNTLACASSADAKGTKVEQATIVGKLIADNAKKVGVDNVVFDRGGFVYHGRVTHDQVIKEFEKVGNLITKNIKGLSSNPNDNAKIEDEVKNEVIELCSKFPIYNHLIKE